MNDQTDIRPHPRATTPPPLPATCKRCGAPVALHWGRGWQWVEPGTHQLHVCDGEAA